MKVLLVALGIWLSIQHSNFLSLGFAVTCLSISNDEIAGARPEMNIKVAASVKA